MTPGTLRLEGLVGSHPGFRLGPIGLDLAPGEVVTVLGPSGSGKTTLLRAVAGLDHLLDGEVLWEGQAITRTQPEDRRMGYVPQGLALFPHRTVEQNVAFPLLLDGERRTGAAVRDLLDRFGLLPLSHRYPRELSYGQRQRVAMARALASRPRVLLWDEPLSALDVVARDDLIEVLREVTGPSGPSLLLVTHDPSVAYSLADRFLVLSSGTVSFLGTPGDFLRSPPDAFGARFAGYENVWERAVLLGEPTAWSRTLLEHSGPWGLAFSASSLKVGAGERKEVEIACSVRRVHWTPEGVVVGLQAHGHHLVLRMPPKEGPPAIGSPLTVSISTSDLHPMGAESSGGDLASNRP